MGLDMYLTGDRFFATKYDAENKIIPNREEEGFPVERERLELAYWRKHPDLHGFIIETFAAGVDECQEIFLTAESLQTILDAVKGAELPHTEGFFFGESSDEDRQPTIEALEKAIIWINTEVVGIWKSVHYRASW